MIGQLSGNVSYKGDKFAIINASGVGYKVYFSKEALEKLPALGEKVEIWTHLSVREDALDLFGFLHKSELDFFELLLGVSGVGPRSALAIVSLAPPENLAQAIVTNNLAYLTQVSGIGKKMAEKIIVELKDKLLTLNLETKEGLEGESEALLALQALGYSSRDAREALKSLPQEVTDTGEKIKKALKLLGDKKF